MDCIFKNFGVFLLRLVVIEVFQEDLFVGDGFSLFLLLLFLLCEHIFELTEVGRHVDYKK